MDILLVTGRFPQRSETFIYRKAVALANRGHRVTVAARGKGDWSLYPDPLPATLHVEVFPPEASLRSPRTAISATTSLLRSATTMPSGVRELYDLCRRDPRTRGHAHRMFLRHLPFVGRRPDLIHFEFLGLGAMYPLAAEVTGAATIISCRGQDVHLLSIRPPEERAASIEILRDADALHCVSNELAGIVEGLTGRRKAVWVNRPAVDTATIKARPPSASAEEPIRILVSGRLVWVKGLDYLLAAFARLVERGVAFHADLVGGGELHAAMRFSIGDLGLEKHVTLVGGVASADVLSRLQTTDVFVLSSFEEGLSNGVLEAMASGVPVVTTNAGGMNEAVTDGVEGFVVPIRDADALADRIERLVKDRALREAMGRAGRARAEAEFSIARQVGTFETIYRSMAGDRR